MSRHGAPWITPGRPALLETLSLLFLFQTSTAHPRLHLPFFPCDINLIEVILFLCQLCLTHTLRSSVFPLQTLLLRIHALTFFLSSSPSIYFCDKLWFSTVYPAGGHGWFFIRLPGVCSHWPKAGCVRSGSASAQRHNQVPNWSWLRAGCLRSQANQAPCTSPKNMSLIRAVDPKSKLKCSSFALHINPSSTPPCIHSRVRWQREHFGGHHFFPCTSQATLTSLS